MQTQIFRANRQDGSTYQSTQFKEYLRSKQFHFSLYINSQTVLLGPKIAAIRDYKHAVVAYSEKFVMDVCEMGIKSAALVDCSNVIFPPEVGELWFPPANQVFVVGQSAEIIFFGGGARSSLSLVIPF
jgi:hypothetical protein